VAFVKAMGIANTLRLRLAVAARERDVDDARVTCGNKLSAIPDHGKPLGMAAVNGQSAIGSVSG